MQNIELNTLLELALGQKKNEWHFHFLTPHCMFNDSAQYKIILETKDQNYSAETNHKPLEQLEKLEDHFYERGN